jgi:hypothetical protein
LIAFKVHVVNGIDDKVVHFVESSHCRPPKVCICEVTVSLFD